MKSENIAAGIEIARELELNSLRRLQITARLRELGTYIPNSKVGCEIFGVSYSMGTPVAVSMLEKLLQETEDAGATLIKQLSNL